MNYRETVRSIQSFMRWNHIPTFESDLSEPDKSNNPWKGKLPKRPARISVAMPPDDWLCQKLEKLNTVVVEGYPSRAQDSAGLKKDQFVKVPKSQNRLYQMHMIRLEGPHRPGKTLFYCVNTSYLVDRCICPAPCRSRQTLEKNVLSWALAGTGSVLFNRQVAVQPTCRCSVHAYACALPLFVWRHI